MKTCSIKYLYCYVAFFIISSLAISGVPKRKIRLNTDDSRIADKRETAHAKKKSHNAKKEPDLEKTTAMRFEKAAVAADNVMCSKIGRDIMKDKKGSAVDAIIATHHCVEVVNLHSTGLGGGGFMLVYEKKSGKSSAFDFRETLPEEYVDTTNKTQGETILVPGVLRGLESAHNKYGKLPWKELFTPAIKLAEEGFKIHEALAAAIKKKKDYIMTNLGLRELFAPNNELLKLGDILKRPKLAKTYRQIANNGAKEFYSGEIARQIIEDVKEVGGVMTSKDLASYRTIERGPLRTTVGGFEMLTTPPPGAGSLLALALKIMDGYNWTAKDLKDRPALTYHRIIEAMKFAYAPFTFLGDPRYTNHTDEVVKYMLDEKVANNMRARIDNVSHTVDYYQPYSKLSIEEANGTSHMSALGPNGDAVSLTSSINAYFGSKLLSRELGFIYNNELADFSEFWPSVYNLTSDKKVPGKRPMSKSSPTIFVNPQTKNVEGVFGAAGGFFIPSCMLMTIGNWLFFHDDLKVAVSRPRLHCQLFPPTVVYEPTFPVELVPQLESYSHAYVTNSTYDVSGQLNAIMGVVQAITRDDEGKIAAESDYRKGGLPAGF